MCASSPAPTTSSSLTATTRSGAPRTRWVDRVEGWVEWVCECRARRTLPQEGVRPCGLVRWLQAVVRSRCGGCRLDQQPSFRASLNGLPLPPGQVWGLVDEWFATDFIISQRYKCARACWACLGACLRLHFACVVARRQALAAGVHLHLQFPIAACLPPSPFCALQEGDAPRVWHRDAHAAAGGAGAHRGGGRQDVERPAGPAARPVSGSGSPLHCCCSRDYFDVKQT